MNRHQVGKRGIIIRSFIALAIMLSLPSFTWGYFYNITPQCQNDICITGQAMNWSIRLTNDGKKNIEYSKIEIIDARNLSVLAEFDSHFNPLSTVRGKPLLSIPLKGAKIVINSSVPLPHEEGIVDFYPCFTNIVSDSYVLAKYGEYVDYHCYLENQSIIAVECLRNAHCAAKSACVKNACAPLSCAPCEYIKDHFCVRYPCCEDSHCPYNAYCMNRTCLPITCLPTQYLFNRTCIGIQCAESEVLLNRSCVPLDCKEDEQAQNHTCNLLSCAQDEIPSNHSCQSLGCSPYEAPINHTCVALDCRWDEAYHEHSCVPLDCAIWQDIENHKCLNNKALILKLAFEILALVLIVLFLVLDIHRYRHRSDPKKNQAKLQATSPKKNELDEELKTLQEKVEAKDPKIKVPSIKDKQKDWALDKKEKSK